MRGTAKPQPNIWSAALMAANCRAFGAKGRSYRVRWQCAPDHVRFAARDEVVVEPLGVRLSAGDVLEVRWAPNDTAYTLAVVRG
jgi:hypothetical protein